MLQNLSSAAVDSDQDPLKVKSVIFVKGHLVDIHVKLFSILTGVVTVQDSLSGKFFSSILNLAKIVQKSPIKCLKEQNIHRKQSVYAYLIVNI